MAVDEVEEKEAPVKELDEEDISLLKTYGLGPYASHISAAEKDIKEVVKRVHEVCGIKESDTGLAAPSRWDLVSDKQAMQEEQPLQVGAVFVLSLSAGFQVLQNYILDPEQDFDDLILLGLQVSRCTKIIKPGTEDAKYVINIKQIAKVRHLPELVSMMRLVLHSNMLGCFGTKFTD